MKKSRGHRWLVVAGVLAVVVSLGAVACGSSDRDEASTGQGVVPAGAGIQADDGASGTGGIVAQRPALQRRQAMQDRREARAERRQAMVESAREKMSATDQALFDQLTATIEQQRSAAQEARQKLADTLKELRALVDKYLDLNSSGTD
jgi:hypothetical protein